MSIPIESAFARLQAYFDPPNCGCKIPRITQCVAAGTPCVGECECPYAIPKPCKHAMAKLFDLPWLAQEDDTEEARRKMERLCNVFARLYAVMHPEEFPTPPPPAELLTPAERTTEYMRRAAARRVKGKDGRQRKHPRAEVVSRRDQTTMASVGYKAVRAANSRVIGYKLVKEQGRAGTCRVCRCVEPLTDGLCGDCLRARRTA